MNIWHFCMSNTKNWSKVAHWEVVRPCISKGANCLRDCAFLANYSWSSARKGQSYSLVLPALSCPLGCSQLIICLLDHSLRSQSFDRGRAPRKMWTGLGQGQCRQYLISIQQALHSTLEIRSLSSLLNPSWLVASPVYSCQIWSIKSGEELFCSLGDHM